MAVAKRDENFATVGMGVSTADSTTPLMLKQDPVTDRLIIKYSGAYSSTPTAITYAKRDQNGRPVALGLGTDGNVYPVRVDPATGAIILKVLSFT